MFFIFRIFPYFFRIRENTDQKKFRIWTLFTQWELINHIDTRCATRLRNPYDENPKSYSEPCQKKQDSDFCENKFFTRNFASLPAVIFHTFPCHDRYFIKWYFNFLLPLLSIPSVVVLVIEITTTLWDWHNRISELNNCGFIGKKTSKDSLFQHRDAFRTLPNIYD